MCHRYLQSGDVHRACREQRLERDGGHWIAFWLGCQIAARIAEANVASRWPRRAARAGIGRRAGRREGGKAGRGEIEGPERTSRSGRRNKKCSLGKGAEGVACPRRSWSVTHPKKLPALPPSSDHWSHLSAARPLSLALGEAFARTKRRLPSPLVERTWVREHRTGAKTSRSGRSPRRPTTRAEGGAAGAVKPEARTRGRGHQLK